MLTCRIQVKCSIKNDINRKMNGFLCRPAESRLEASRPLIEKSDYLLRLHYQKALWRRNEFCTNLQQSQKIFIFMLPSEILL